MEGVPEKRPLQLEIDFMMRRRRRREEEGRRGRNGRGRERSRTAPIVVRRGWQVGCLRNQIVKLMRRAKCEKSIVKKALTNQIKPLASAEKYKKMSRY